MTVQYNQLVLTGGPGVFFRLLLRWRGCVLKLIYGDLFIFLVLYYSIFATYRYALTEPAKRYFEKLIIFTRNFQSMIPVAFVLGFYINLIFKRFWTHFMTIPWGLKFSIALAAHLPGVNDHACLMRRTCLRYLLGSLIMTCTRLNVVARKRFPNDESFIAAHIFTEEELAMINDIQPAHIQPFVPIVWTTSLLTRAEKEGLISNHHALSLIVTEVNNFRQGLLKLFLMDHVCVPLVYTQVVTLAVYSYFAASLVGRQYLIDGTPLSKEKLERDFYFPFFTVIELLIYVGWLKVAETLANPMGEDDEDLDVNEIIDYNWKCCWSIIDGMHTSPPTLVRDLHWHKSVVELPHTKESKRLFSQSYRGSVFDLNLIPQENEGTATAAGSMLSLTGTGMTSRDRGPQYGTSLENMNRLNHQLAMLVLDSAQYIRHARMSLYSHRSFIPSHPPTQEASRTNSVMLSPLRSLRNIVTQGGSGSQDDGGDPTTSQHELESHSSIDGQGPSGSMVSPSATGGAGDHHYHPLASQARLESVVETIEEEDEEGSQLTSQGQHTQATSSSSSSTVEPSKRPPTHSGGGGKSSGDGSDAHQKQA